MISQERSSDNHDIKSKEVKVLEQDNWYHLDNVAKIFLANHNRRDTRTMRISYTLFEDVDPDILKEALLKTIKSLRHFQVRIRRGLFWHYVEPTDVLPEVTEEYDRPCPELYGKNYRGVLHYRVTYYHSRINLDMFHGIADGTGALEFLNTIVYNYLAYKYPGDMKGVVLNSEADQESRNVNSYRQYYEHSDSFRVSGDSTGKAYHVHGLKLPYEQLQFFEVHMNVKEVIAKSKELKVSLTSYLGAKLMLALYSDMPAMAKKMPITISMPVNLRNYFPSETARNFFNSVSVSHIFTGDETLESLALEYDAKFKERLKKENLTEQMHNFERIEHIMFTRLVPLAIKQPVVKYFSRKSAKTVSAVISNMGAIKLPVPMSEKIKEVSAYCASDDIFIVVNSYGDDLVMGISYPYQATGVLKTFIRSFHDDSSEIRVAATEVVR